MDKTKYGVFVKCFTYNQSQYISDTLNGFCEQQTNFPFVCCIIDDASKDGEPDIILQYLKEHFDFTDSSSYTKETDEATILFAPHLINRNCFFAVFLLKINLFKNEKRKNSLISEWSNNSKYEAICEGDDYWIDPLKLQKQVDYMESHPDCSLCHTGFKFYYQDDNKYLVDSGPAIKDDSATLEQVVSGYYVQTCTAMYKVADRIDFRKKNEFLFGGYFKMGDFPTWYELRKCGYVHWMSDVSSIYRKNRGSLTRASSVASYYRFALSSAEIRYYVTTRDNLSDSLKEETYYKFRKALINYLSFDKSFVSKVEFQYTLTSKEKFIINSGLLARYLSLRLIFQQQAGRIYRRLKKTY